MFEHKKALRFRRGTLFHLWAGNRVRRGILGLQRHLGLHRLST